MKFTASNLHRKVSPKLRCEPNRDSFGFRVLLPPHGTSGRAEYKTRGGRHRGPGWKDTNGCSPPSVPMFLSRPSLLVATGEIESKLVRVLAVLGVLGEVLGSTPG